MPQFELRDVMGYSWSCSSGDPQLLARWLMETIVRVSPKESYGSNHSPLQLRVFPMNVPDGDGPDWPRQAWLMIGTDGTTGQPDTPIDRVRKVIAWLQAEVERSNTG